MHGRRLLIGALLLAQAGCMRDEETIQPAGEAFSLMGRVIEVRMDVEPEGLPTEGGEAGVGGALLVRSGPIEEDTLDDCTPAEKNAYAVFFTEETQFDPPRVTAEPDFPKNLMRTGVAIEGLFYRIDTVDGGCAIVAQTVGVRTS